MKVASVEEFQGGEKRAVIVSAVRGAVGEDRWGEVGQVYCFFVTFYFFIYLKNCVCCLFVTFRLIFLFFLFKELVKC